MTTPFDTPLAGFRFVKANYADTLRDIALRELGDATQWQKLVAINNLLPPYLTDDPTQRGPQVLLNGTDYIIIPSAQSVSQTTNPDDVFKTDILLTPTGMLALNGSGDFQTVSGIGNLRQALKNALKTDEQELVMHPEYGSLINRILGSVNGPTANMLAADYARQTVEADSRINSVTAANAETVNDSITVSIFAQTVNGSPVDVSANL